MICQGCKKRDAETIPEFKVIRERTKLKLVKQVCVQYATYCYECRKERGAKYTPAEKRAMLSVALEEKQQEKRDQWLSTIQPLQTDKN